LYNIAQTFVCFSTRYFAEHGYREERKDGIRHQ